MGLLDGFLAKWKHPDPEIREPAVRQLDDQNQLETIATEDPSEAVRRAAVETLTCEDALLRIARSTSPFAMTALERISANPHLVRVAQTAELREVRERAVDRIEDGVALHRIAACDPEAWVRTRARVKSVGTDHARDFIKETLSKLELARNKAGATAELCGTLDDVCMALLRDPRFRINGSMAEDDAKSEPAGASARFVAARRNESGEPEPPGGAVRFYEISVWRTEQDGFTARAEERQLAVKNDPGVWSRAAGGETHR